MHPRPGIQRQFFLDWLRIGAFGLLLTYHVGMLYVSWDWHLKSPAASTLIEPLMRLSNPWRMSLLFVLAGAATVWMFRARPAGLLRERAARLLLPLLTGVLLVVPPQPWFEVGQKLGYAGSYLEFLGLYFSGFHGFCPGGRCLVLPTWNHLWFLPYLFVYTALALGLARWLGPERREGLAERFGRLAGWQLWLLPMLPLALWRVTLYPLFGSTNALVDDIYQHASFLTVFLLGAGLAATPALFDRLVAWRWPALALALVAWWSIGLVVEHARSGAAVPEAWREAQRAAWAVQQWSTVVALLGFARRHLDHDHPWRAPLNEAVFPVYLLHQTLIIALAAALLPRALHPAAEAALIGGLTLLLALLAWRLLRHTGPLRPWFGLPRR